MLLSIDNPNPKNDTMDTLPQEMLDEILWHIFDRHQPVTERFETFTSASIQTILACRLVARRWFESEVLIRIFAALLSETPMVWYNHRLPVLEEISEIPKYASCFSHGIAICSMDMGLVEYGENERWGSGRDELDEENPIVPYLVHLLRRFSCVEHFRFYPINPKCLNGSWPNWKISKEKSVPVDTGFRATRIPPGHGYPALTEGEYSWHGVQRESAWIFSRIMEGFWYSGLELHSIESPLFGNRASFCATEVPCSEFRWSPFTWFGAGLTRIAITITRTSRITIFDETILRLENLEYLEITMSRTPENLPYWNWGLPETYWLHRYESQESGSLKKLKEFRLMSDQQHFYSASDLLKCLRRFPSLENVAFGHILLCEGDWDSLVQQLASFNLKKVWLLDPRDLVHNPQELVTDDDGPGIRNVNMNFQMIKYVAGQHFSNAALEARLIDSNSLWTSDRRPGLRRDFEYPGFRTFEVEDEEQDG